MSVKNCINAKVKAGIIPPHRVDEVTALYDELEAEALTSMAPAAARAFADTEVKKLITRQFNLERRQTLLQAAAQVRIQKNLDAYRTASGNRDPAAAMLAHLGHDDNARGVSNIEARHKAVLGQLHGQMADVLRTFKRTLTGGVRSRAKMENLVREAFGEASDDASARELAQAWGDAAEGARARFNAGGGDIPKRKDWGLPQSHDPVLVRKLGREAWIREIKPRLDAERMIDPVTQLPMKADRLDEALDAVYDTIASEGFAKVTPSGTARGKKLANRRTDHRFLVFKDAHNWLDYNARFGARDPFSAMVSHLDSMARDIAKLEVLGPNPTSTLRFLEQTVEKDAAIQTGKGRDKAVTRAKRAIDTQQKMMAIFDGSINDPVNPGVARVFGDIRNVLTSAQLGAAFLSATADVSFQRMAAKFSGLKFSGTMAKLLKVATDGATQEQMVRAGLVAEHWTENALGMARFQQDFLGGDISRRLADSVLRVSGLSPWTQSGRFAFGWEFMGAMADNRTLKHADLPAPFKRALDRYGIDPKAWDDIRAIKPYSHKGVTFIRPEDVRSASGLDPARAEDLATRYLEMVQTEMEFAVPTASLRARAALPAAAAKPGSIVGEILRSATMYKNFAVTIMFTHVRRGVQETQRNGGAAGLGYLSDLMVSATLMGGMAMQMKEMAKGRDPRPMVGDKGAAFWGAAMLQGGGLGIFGDFLFSDINRFGGGLAQTLAGPVVQAADDARELTIGNALEALDGQKTNAGREAVRFARKHTPGSSLWYTRLAIERNIFDRLDMWADPAKAAAANRRRARAAQKDFSTGFWWAPGQATPARAPDIANAANGN